MSKFNYQAASVEEVAQHYKTASRQVIYQTRKAYEHDGAMLDKLDKAVIMAKIARLQDELGVLEFESIGTIKTAES